MPDDPRMPSADDPYPLVLLEEDENIPPRPEDEVADIARTEPDPHA